MSAYLVTCVAQSMSITLKLCSCMYCTPLDPVLLAYLMRGKYAACGNCFAVLVVLFVRALTHHHTGAAKYCQTHSQAQLIPGSDTCLTCYCCCPFRYSIQMATAGTPFYKFWSTVVNTYADRGLIPRSDQQQFTFFMNRCAEWVPHD